MPGTRVCVGILLAFVTASAAAATPAELSSLFQDYWEYRMRQDPTWATYLGDHRYGDRLEDLSEKAHLAHVDSLRAYLERSQRVDGDALEDADRLNVEILKRSLRLGIEEARFRGHLVPVSQQSGPHIGFPQIIETQPFDTVELCDAYVARLHAFAVQVDQIIENMRKGMAAGIVAYRVSIERAIPQVRDLKEGAASEHVLAQVGNRLGDAIEPAEKDRIVIEVELAVEEQVIPAYAKLASFLQKQYLPACRDVPGINALPHGRDWYAFAVRRYTTTDLEPTEVHEIGLREMERILGEMNEIREQVGFAGELSEFFAHLREDPVFYHESPEALLEEYRELLDAMDRRLPELFGTLPDAACDLREIESYRAAAAPAAYYYGPPDDGSRPGYFYVNTYDLTSRPRYTMAALAYHEAVPGHHLQIALQREMDLPDFRRHQGFTAFVEGWALYAERLASEVGGYVDPYAEFGRLTFEGWRAARLVVDTGIHAFGWSRHQAIDYLLQNVGLSEHDVVSEVDRYIARPGQALAYKIGELEIRELRRAATAELGGAFDVRAFHDAVLENGALPLDLLRIHVESWVAARGSARTER